MKKAEAVEIKISTEGATDSLPLSESGGGDGVEATAVEGWPGKVSAIKEAKMQIFFCIPVVMTNASYYCIPLVSVMFAGHLGELELASSTLANSWASVTGFTLMVGLSGSLETLCGQGYGAKVHRMLGIYLQGSCIISFFFSIIISVVWLNSKPILTLLHQDPHISEMAALYIKHLIPGLFAYGFLQNILKFIETQSIVKPLFFLSTLPLIIHLGITYALVHWTSFSFKGAAVATSISLWISVISLGLYVLSARKFSHTWDGFTLESLDHVLENLKLALPSAAMVCLEYWAAELLVLFAGLMPNSNITTSLIAMCDNTETTAYMIACGLSAAASTRVSNELGAGNSDRAKHAMSISIKLSIVLALMAVLFLALGHHFWVSFFTESFAMHNAFASMTPLLAVSIFLDSIQGVLSGVARGCGWQKMAVCINLATFYLIGMPIAAFLGLKLKLYGKGLWIGFICGLWCQAIALLLLVWCRQWSIV